MNFSAHFGCANSYSCLTNGKHFIHMYIHLTIRKNRLMIVSLLAFFGKMSLFLTHLERVDLFLEFP